MNPFPLPSELNLIGQQKPVHPPWKDLRAVEKKWKPRIYGVLSNVVISDVQPILNLIDSPLHLYISSSLKLSGTDKALTVAAKTHKVTKSGGEPKLRLVIRASNYD